MSDKVQTAILWLQRIAQIIGVLLALLGGGQTAAVKLAPDSYGSAENEEAANDNLLHGLALTVVAPVVAWGVRKGWELTRGKKAAPHLDLIAAEASVTQLELYLATPLPDIRQKIADTYSKASKKPTPPFVVEAK